MPRSHKSRRRRRQVGQIPAKVLAHRRALASRPTSSRMRREAWLAASQFVAIAHPLESVREEAMAFLRRQDERNEAARNRRTFNDVREVTALENGIVQNTGRLPMLPPNLAPAYFHRVEARKLKRMRQLADRAKLAR